MNIPRSILALAILFFSLYSNAADKLTVIHSLNPNAGDGSGPTGTLFMDKAGNLYGDSTSGVVFQLTSNGSGGWNYNVLSTCCAYGLGGIVMDNAGNLYGTTFFGELFELSPTTSGPWTFSIPFTFSGSDAGIQSSLIIDAAGNLYGASSNGGPSNLGYVFELSPTSGGWVLTHLHDYSGTDGAEGAGADGAYPDASLVMDASGNLFGTASQGGPSNFGVVFEVMRTSTGWKSRDIHAFTGLGFDGAYPNAPMVFDSAGNLYGITAGGGMTNECTVENANGCGTAFELIPNGNTWKEVILHNFKAQGDGGVPGGVIRDANDNLFGGALFGGPFNNAGVIFELSPTSAK